MYAIGNVEKFLKDNAKDINPGEAAAILERARKLGKTDGVLMAGWSEEIWGNAELKESFGRAMEDPEHMKIGIAAMNARKRKN